MYLKEKYRKQALIAGAGNRMAVMFMQRMLPRKLAVKIMRDNISKIYRDLSGYSYY